MRDRFHAGRVLLGSGPDPGPAAQTLAAECLKPEESDLTSRLVTWALALVIGCGSDDLVCANGAPDRSLSLVLGQELELTLQSIGPGDYASPPAISSPAVQFVEVTLMTPAVPAGVTQRFRFRAVAPGQAVITFQHTGQSPTVEDTVNVQ